jgi:Protocatechuate 3,4-dioxygenase beta subunit
MLKYFRFPAIICGLLLLVPTAFAQTGGIKGKVRNQKGDSIGNAQISIRQDGKVVKSGTANNKGEFEIAGLKSGFYNVAFDADGYGTGVLQSVEIKDKVRDLGGRLILSVDQGSQVILRGSVFYKEGTSVTGAKVDLEQVNADGTIKKLGSAYTTISGDFTFRRPGGVAKYRLTAKFKGSTASKDIDVDNPAIYRTALMLGLSRTEK